jgi:hypothetical protein
VKEIAVAYFKPHSLEQADETRGKLVSCRYLRNTIQSRCVILSPLSVGLLVHLVMLYHLHSILSNTLSTA